MEHIRIDNLLEHGPWLERLAHGLIEDPHSADDALQSTWITALRKPPRTAKGARSWLRRVLINEVFLGVRRERRRRHHEVLARSGADTSPDPAVLAETSELRAEIVRLVIGLSEPYRSTLRLRVCDGLSTHDVASRLGVSDATVRWRVMRGLEKLRAELRRRHPDRALPALLLPLMGSNTPESTAASPHGGSWLRTVLTSPVAGALAAVLILLGGVLFVDATPERTATEALLSVAPTVRPQRALDVPERESAPEVRETLEPPAIDRTDPAGTEDPAPAAAPSFAVEVVDPQGGGVPDATIFAFTRASAEFEEIGRTDASGRASVHVAQADLGAWGGRGTRGRTALRAAAEGWAFSEVVFPSARGDRPPVRLVLPGPETIIEGTMLTEHGAPVAGGVIEAGYAQSNQLSGIVTEDLSMPQPLRARTDDLGRFRIRGVDGSSGRVRLHAESLGNLAVFGDIAVDRSGERQLELVVQRAGRVRGTVRDPGGAPVAGARVWYEPVERGGDAAVRASGYDRRLRGFTAVATAGLDGQFELTGVPIGTQLVWAQDPARPRFVAHAWLAVGREVAADWNAELAGVTPLEVVLDHRPETRAGWIVRIWFVGPGDLRCIREAETDEHGVARFFETREGPIDVAVFASDTGFVVGRAHLDRAPTSPVRIDLDRPGRITGEVLGDLDENFALRLVPRDGVAPGTVVPHDAESGHFDQALTSGAYTLLATYNHSKVPVASFELAANEHEDLGTIPIPPIGSLRIECARTESTRRLEYLLDQVAPPLPPGTNARVEVGEWPAPARRKLLAGRYLLTVRPPGGDVLRRYSIDLEAPGEVLLRVDL